MNNSKLYSTLPIENAPKIKILGDYSDEICLAIDDNNDQTSNKNMNQKSKLLEEQHLAPVTIMVADKISSVKSRKLSKVLLYKGSTTALINCRCLPNLVKGGSTMRLGSLLEMKAID